MRNVPNVSGKASQDLKNQAEFRFFSYIAFGRAIKGEDTIKNKANRNGGCTKERCKGQE